MKSVHDQIRQGIFDKCGISTPPAKTTDSYEDLVKSEWSPLFERFMKNRLVMGALRYGKFNPKSRGKYNRVDSIRQRIELYSDDGNGEHLVDIANICMCEFVEQNHPKYHFNAADDKNHQEAK